MDVSLLHFLITNYILQQNCFICFTKIWPPITKKKQSLSEFDQLAKIDLWFIVSLLDHSPLTIIHSQNSVLLEKCTLGNQRGQQSVLRARNQCSVFFLHRPFLFDVWDVGCRHRWWGSYVFVLQRAFLLQEVSTQRLYRKKLHLCHQTALYKSFYV